MNSNFFSSLNIFSVEPTLSWYELSWPKELDTEKVHAWLKAIGGNPISQGMRFLISAQKDRIRHYIALPARHEQNLLASLQSFLPEVVVSEGYIMFLQSQLSAKLRMTSKHRVLHTKHPDIISFAMLSALQTLGNNESIVLLWILGQTFSPAVVSADATHLGADSIVGGVLQALTGKVPAKLDAVALKSMRAKYSSASWNACLFIGVTADKNSRRKLLLNRIIGGCKIAEAPGVRLGSRRYYFPLHCEGSTPLFWPLKINVDELLGLLAWPLGNRNIVGLTRNVSRQLPIPYQKSTSDFVVGVSSQQGSTTQLLLSPQDALMHTHIYGPTGVGKSNLQLNLITQQIQKGYSVIVVDPKGDLIQDVLCRIPANRQSDVVVLDPSDLTYPVGLNPLANSHKNTSLIADDILSIFLKLYGGSIGPRSKDILHAGLLTLLKNPNPNICLLPHLFTNVQFRTELISRINDPLGLGSFWLWYENLSPAERNAALAPLMNKLRPFLLRPNFRYILGQYSPKFSIEEVFTKRKILLINAAKGILGSEGSKLFGSFAILQIVQAAQARAAIPIENRYPVFIHIDEMQDLFNISRDITEVLAQFRGYKVGMTLVNQHLGQLPKELKSGILANGRSKICFQLSEEDAKETAQGSTVLTPEDFQNLPRHHIYAKLVRNGHVSEWVSAQTLPPSDKISDPDAIRHISRQLYGTLASEVDIALSNSLASSPYSPPLGSVSETTIGRKKLHNVIVDSRFGYKNKKDVS